MIKLFVMVPRLPALSRQEFHDHWRHPHASLGRDLPGMVDLVQSHQFDSEYLGADQADFEGIGEAWFGSVADALEMKFDPHFKKYVQPDEINFIDLPKLEFLFTEEEILVERATRADGVADIDAWWCERERPTSVKLLQFVRSDGNPDWAADGDHDRALGARIGALRHVRARASREAHGDESNYPGVREEWWTPGNAPAYLGVRELWWPTLTAFERGIRADPEAWDVLRGLGGRSALTVLADAERWPPLPSTMA